MTWAPIAGGRSSGWSGRSEGAPIAQRAARAAGGGGARRGRGRCRIEGGGGGLGGVRGARTRQRPGAEVRACGYPHEREIHGFGGQVGVGGGRAWPSVWFRSGNGVFWLTPSKN